MQKNAIKLLFVDDDEDDFLLTKEFLSDISDKTFDVHWASTFEKGVEELHKDYDILVFDFLLGAKTGIDLLIKAKEIGCESPVILLTGRGDLKTDMEAMRLGAADYLVKSELDTEKLDRSIRYALERAEASRALKESEEKYRSIFEKSRDMIYITNEKGKFLDFNDSAIRIFGYNREELFQLDAKDLYYDPEDRFTFLKTINRTGAVSNYEVTLKHKSGEKRYCLISGTVQRAKTDEGDPCINYLGIIHDITRRKQAEKELLIAEKLAVTGRIVRTLAHEIRNPLTNINLSLEQLKSEVENPELGPYFEIIKRNSKRINDLITDLLQSSRPAEVSRQRYSISEVVEETLQLAMDRLTLKGIALQRNYNCEQELSLDKEKMKIALLNIIINAIEAMPEKTGVLKVETQLVDDKCQITIEDNGSGITKEHIGRLFEPYFTNKSSGVGLGLATTHNILKSHNANIDVESETGVGSKFIISMELESKHHEIS